MAAKPKRRNPGHRKRMAYLRGKLVEHRRRLLAGIEQERKLRGRRGVAEPSDSVDIATDSSDDDMSFRIVEISSSEVIRIDEALRKMKEGTYGICEECGERIPATRHKVMPAASLCISCQEECEAEEKVEQSPEGWHRVTDPSPDAVPERERVIYAEGA